VKGKYPVLGNNTANQYLQGQKDGYFPAHR